MDDEHNTHSPKPLSDLLHELVSEAGDTIQVSELIERFGSRAFGAILFIFAFACTLPLPPGASTVFGAPLVLLAPQVALGARAPWLPKAVRRRKIATKHLSHTAERLLPWLRRLERVARPRLGFLFGPLGDRVIGVVCTVLAVVLILPIPLGNLLPGAAVALLALALTTRDGFLALFGYAVTVASTAVLVIAAGIIWRTAKHLIGLFGAA